MNLTLLTYNIRYDNPDDGLNVWTNRREALVSLIQSCEPDIFCVQEALNDQKMYLHHAFPAFGLVGVGRTDGWLRGEMCNIFYRKDRFEKIANGDFWLSETPHVIGSQSWGSALPRIASWIKLLDKDTKQAFFVFNTHFDHESLRARQESAHLLHQKIGEMAGESRAFLTGDFNLPPKENTYKFLTTYFTDLRTLAPTLPTQTSTFNGFGKEAVAGWWIDYVFTNHKEGLEVKSFDVLETKINNRFPSDHFPLVVKVSL